ncbi:MAG: hypothetical protein GY835_24865 [bacterium]|nr:hypothetical protein [bacterium]
MTMTREQVTNCPFAPLPELNPHAFTSELNGLRSLPDSCSGLKLIYAVKALEPFADQGPTATGRQRDRQRRG